MDEDAESEVLADLALPAVRALTAALQLEIRPHDGHLLIIGWCVAPQIVVRAVGLFHIECFYHTQRD